MAIDALVRLHRWWRWLLAGGSDSLDRQPNMQMMRLTSTGILDPEFGRGGFSVISYAPEPSFATDLVSELSRQYVVGPVGGEDQETFGLVGTGS